MRDGDEGGLAVALGDESLQIRQAYVTLVILWDHLYDCPCPAPNLLPHSPAWTNFISASAHATVEILTVDCAAGLCSWNSTGSSEVEKATTSTQGWERKQVGAPVPLDLQEGNVIGAILHNRCQYAVSSSKGNAIEDLPPSIAHSSLRNLLPIHERSPVMEIFRVQGGLVCMMCDSACATCVHADVALCRIAISEGLQFSMVASASYGRCRSSL
jgi:hypothetical protein